MCLWMGKRRIMEEKSLAKKARLLTIMPKKWSIMPFAGNRLDFDF